MKKLLRYPRWVILLYCLGVFLQMYGFFLQEQEHKPYWHTTKARPDTLQQHKWLGNA